MDGFFTLSKVAWVVLAPSTGLIVVSVAAFALSGAWKPARAIGRKVGFAAAALLAAFALTPVSDLLLAPLERRFPALDDAELKLTPVPVAGIIVLGGGIGSVAGPDGTFRAGLTESADRLREAAWLARAFPSAPVVLSGGVAFSRPGEPTEAILMSEVFSEFGVPRARLTLEDHSRTTAENAAAVARLIKTPGAWLLVTSAFHMPRAVATFEAAGVHVIPAPTDWRLDAKRSWLLMNAAENLARTDLAVKEWMGLIGYRLAGRTKVLFPPSESLISIAQQVQGAAADQR